MGFASRLVTDASVLSAGVSGQWDATDSRAAEVVPTFGTIQPKRSHWMVHSYVYAGHPVAATPLSCPLCSTELSTAYIGTGSAPSNGRLSITHPGPPPIRTALGLGTNGPVGTGTVWDSMDQVSAGLRTNARKVARVIGS
jgi:hypothetical protein